MRFLMNGLSGWARFQPSNNHAVQLVDTALTVVGTLIVALGWLIVRH